MNFKYLFMKEHQNKALELRRQLEELTVTFHRKVNQGLINQAMEVMKDIESLFDDLVTLYEVKRKYEETLRKWSYKTLERGLHAKK